MKIEDLVAITLIKEEILKNPMVKWRVFEDGLVNYLRGPYDAGLEAFLEDREWIFKDDHEHLFSFTNLCNEFGIHPQRLRASLLEYIRNCRPASRKTVN